MFLCFNGVKANAERQLREIEKIAKTTDDYDEEEHPTWAVECCISSYHDALLAIIKGSVPIEEIKNFMFHGKTDEEIAAMPFCGKVISFNEERNE